ncbi:hypothetical protein BHE74_00053479 [Ensete ventricosum]|nr:hypothetical protein BHE74_00053479 [Ensete ventricosum]
MRPQVKVSALPVSGRSYRPYLCQVGRTTTGVSALPVSGRPYDRWRPHTCVRLACRVGSATSAGQLSEGAMMWWPGHHVPYHSPREDLLGAPDEGVADEVLCLATGARDGDVARVDPTEQELGNCDVARVDPTEQELGNCDVARVDPTEQELGMVMSQELIRPSRSSGIAMSQELIRPNRSSGIAMSQELIRLSRSSGIAMSQELIRPSRSSGIVM